MHNKSELHYLTRRPQKYLFDGTKLIYHHKRLQDYLDGKRIAPIHIDMGIHKWCNIRCVYCYGIKQHPSTAFIPQDRLMMLANDAHELGVKSLAIIGDGEPTLNSGLYPFVTRLKQLRVDCSVATNGLLLDETKAKTLTDACTWLRFNVSAVDKYGEIMGTKHTFKDFENIVRMTLATRDSRCTVGLQMVLIPQCFSEVLPLARAACDLGVDYLVIKQFSDPEEAIPVDVDMNEYDKAHDVLTRAEEMSNEKTTIIVKWSALNDSISITRDKHWDFDRCIDLPFIFQISGDGGCYPCGYLFGNSDYKYGDVSKERLTSIIRGEHYWRVVRKVSETPLMALCKGQCRHCETNRFVDRLKKVYKGQLTRALETMCGGSDQYYKMMTHPPEHLNFI